MGTKLKKSDFKSQYAVAYQGLFIFCDARRLPKHHDTINLGQSLSDELMHIPVQQRNINIDLCLSRIVETGCHRRLAKIVPQSEGMCALAGPH